MDTAKRILFANTQIMISFQGNNLLVREKHKQSNQNRKLLEEKKLRCILKQNLDLTEYSKEIKPLFDMFTSTNISCKLNTDSTSAETKVQDKAICILQITDVNNQQITIFYDTGWGDMKL